MKRNRKCAPPALAQFQPAIEFIGLLETIFLFPLVILNGFTDSIADGQSIVGKLISNLQALLNLVQDYNET